MKSSDTYESKEFALPDSPAAMQDDADTTDARKRARDDNDSVASSSSSVEHVDKKAKLLPHIKRDGDFKDLVTKSTIFADKSLFIKAVIEDGDTVSLLAMPRRWGKTVNLDMLKRFLEMPLDNSGNPLSREDTDNYKIFHEKFVLQPDGSKSSLKISRSKLLMTDPQNMFGDKKEVDALEVQGTYPVIYIDFKNCKAADFDSVKAKVRTELSESFERHSYLKTSAKLDDEEKQLITKYIGAISSKSLTEDEITSGLKSLSKFLFKHHGQKVWILIDEYDAVANVAYRKFDENNLDKTIGLFSSIYENALKSNGDFLEKGVLTGVQYIAKSGMLSGLNNLGKYDFTSAKYAQYYGLSQEEFETFCTHFSVPEKHFEAATQWYDGYKVRVYDQERDQVTDEIANKYNVWSIISYLKEGDFSRFKSYWEESGNIDFINALFKKTEVREEVENLVGGESIFLVRKDDFSAEDFKQLKKMIDKAGNIKIEQTGLDVLFSYLFIGGYLTIDGEKKDHYQIPNMEIKHEMGRRLIDYYKNICNISPNKIQTLTNTLQQVMDVTNFNDQTNNDIKGSFKHFYDQFKGIIQNMNLVADKNAKGIFTNEDAVHSILNYIVLQTQHSSFGTELYTSKLNSDKKGRADIKITKKDIGIILEVKCVSAKDDGHMKEALKQAISYSNLLEEMKINNRIFVAINVEKEVSKPEERAIELLCGLDVDNHNNQTVFGIDTLGNDSTFGVTDDVFNSMVDDAI